MNCSSFLIVLLEVFMNKVTVPLADFNSNLAEVLPKLIEFIASPILKNHSVWNDVVPYNVPSYGYGQSLGHCIRPDIVLGCDNKPYVCEIDFVPSGRGYLLASLNEEDQMKVLEVFYTWYRQMGIENILYATASTTICSDETRLFSESLRRYFGINIKDVNIDTLNKEDLEGCLVDRLFYRTEMSVFNELGDANVITAEPWLDSKVIFAVIHDNSLDDILIEVLGDTGLKFLREVFPYSILLSSVSDQELEEIAEKRENWVVKNGDVEMSYSWGCRGTFIGANYTKKKFLEILKGSVTAKGKEIGQRPILQHFHLSQNFSVVWNGVVDGNYRQTSLKYPGLIPDPKTSIYATKHVGARIGFYFLVNRINGTCLVPDEGILTLRQDRMVHGASDALVLAATVN